MQLLAGLEKGIYICRVNSLLTMIILSNMKERNKNEQLQQAAMIQQPLAVARQKKTNEKDEFSFELGKFFLDLSKLAFAGIFLTGIRDYSINTSLLVGIGAVIIGLLAFVGFRFIRIGVNKKD